MSFFVSFVFLVIFYPFTTTDFFSFGGISLVAASINIRVTIIAVNILNMIPILNVNANPFIVPVPSQNNNNAANTVVTLASTIVLNARLKPFVIEDRAPTPASRSSFIRSNIIIFA